MGFKTKIGQILFLSSALCGILNIYAADEGEASRKVYTQQEIDAVPRIIKNTSEDRYDVKDYQLAMVIQQGEKNFKALEQAGSEAAEKYLAQHPDLKDVEEAFLSLLQKWNAFPNYPAFKGTDFYDIMSAAQDISKGTYMPTYTMLKYLTLIEELKDMASYAWVPTKQTIFLCALYNHLAKNLGEENPRFIKIKEEIKKKTDALGLRNFGRDGFSSKFCPKMPFNYGYVLKSFEGYKAEAEEKAAGKIQGAWRRGKLRKSAKTQLNTLRQEKVQKMNDVNALWDTLQ